MRPSNPPCNVALFKNLESVAIAPQLLGARPPVSRYRSKFSDCPAGAVANSYPKLDQLWDNVIAGAVGNAPQKCLTASPGPSPRHAAGRDTYDMPSG